MKDIHGVLSEPGAAINPRTANFQLGKLRMLSMKIKGSMESLIDLFLRMEKKMESHGGVPDTNIKNLKNMQNATIIGNLAADAEVKKSKDSGYEFIVFRVAVNEKVGEETRTTYYDVSYNSVKLAPYLRKGKQVCVTGRLQLGVYIRPSDGESFLNARLNAKDVEFVGAKAD